LQAELADLFNRQIVKTALNRRLVAATYLLVTAPVNEGGKIVKSIIPTQSCQVVSWLRHRQRLN
jgi:hypothetical protein